MFAQTVKLLTQKLPTISSSLTFNVRNLRTLPCANSKLNLNIFGPPANLSTEKHCHTSAALNGRYGHRLVKLWEQPEYTTKPLKVYRTGGRLPTSRFGSDEKVPGKKWTSKIGGGLPRRWYWVDNNRLTVEEVKNEVIFQERILKVIEDDNRSGHIALVAGPLKQRWILATETMKPGQLITNCATELPGGTEFKDGDAYPVGLIPVGTKVCSLEFRPGKGAQIARSAGAYCTVSRKTNTDTVVQMPSKREIMISSNCVAVIGRVSNIGHDDVKWGSPQRLREYGLRPKSGRPNIKRDGRFGRKIKPPKHTIVIGDKALHQRTTDFEE
ncbi:large ribosomal subunit protein uL2m [Ciona intestinalis]